MCNRNDLSEWLDVDGLERLRRSTLWLIEDEVRAYGRVGYPISCTKVLEWLDQIKKELDRAVDFNKGRELLLEEFRDVGRRIKETVEFARREGII